MLVANLTPRKKKRTELRQGATGYILNMPSRWDLCDLLILGLFATNISSLRDYLLHTILKNLIRSINHMEFTFYPHTEY